MSWKRIYVKAQKKRLFMNTTNLNIPSAEELEKYEQIKPGYSDRILTLIEKNNAFVQTAYIKEYNTKTILSAFYIILLFIVSTILLFHKTTNSILSIACFIGGLGTLVSGIILIFKQLSQKEKPTSNTK